MFACIPRNDIYGSCPIIHNLLDRTHISHFGEHFQTSMKITCLPSSIILDLEHRQGIFVWYFMHNLSIEPTHGFVSFCPARIIRSYWSSCDTFTHIFQDCFTVTAAISLCEVICDMWKTDHCLTTNKTHTYKKYNANWTMWIIPGMYCRQSDCCLTHPILLFGMVTSWYGNDSLITDCLWGKYIDQLWIPFTMGRCCGFVVFYVNKPLDKLSNCRWFEAPLHPGGVTVNDKKASSFEKNNVSLSSIIVARAEGYGCTCVGLHYICMLLW